MEDARAPGKAPCPGRVPRGWAPCRLQHRAPARLRLEDAPCPSKCYVRSGRVKTDSQNVCRKSKVSMIHKTGRGFVSSSKCQQFIFKCQKFISDTHHTLGRNILAIYLAIAPNRSVHVKHQLFPEKMVNPHPLCLLSSLFDTRLSLRTWRVPPPFTSCPYHSVSNSLRPRLQSPCKRHL